jgi:hypothetical protein
LLVFRFYWDGQEQPSVECPLGDFFAAGWGGFSWSGHTQVSSLPVWTPTDWRLSSHADTGQPGYVTGAP